MGDDRRVSRREKDRSSGFPRLTGGGKERERTTDVATHGIDIVHDREVPAIVHEVEPSQLDWALDESRDRPDVGEMAASNGAVVW